MLLTQWLNVVWQTDLHCNVTLQWHGDVELVSRIEEAVVAHLTRLGFMPAPATPTMVRHLDGG